MVPYPCEDYTCPKCGHYMIPGQNCGVCKIVEDEGIVIESEPCQSTQKP